jgi:hypothetical protein
MKPIRILVTGAGGAPASNFIASLRLRPKLEFFIVGADIDKMHLELTDGLDKKYILPVVDHPDYLKKLNKIIVLEKIDFVHSQTEPEVWFLSHNIGKIKAKTLFPNPKTLEITYDKQVLNNVLAAAKVKVPKTYHFKTVAQLEESLKKALRSNTKAWLRSKSGAGSKASLPVNTVLQVRGWLDYWKKTKNLSVEDFMLSEFLPGKEFAFQSVWYEGKIITSMARERVEYLFGHLFPSGQSSSPSIAKTVHRKDVNELATKAVLAVDPKATGIFCVDVKENLKAEPCVTEINAGRFFTTSNNFSTAGLNMPYYYILLGMGLKNKLPKIPRYNGIPAGWYWLRMIDMGYKLVKGEKWSSKII